MIPIQGMEETVDHVKNILFENRNILLLKFGLDAVIFLKYDMFEKVVICGEFYVGIFAEYQYVDFLIRLGFISREFKTSLIERNIEFISDYRGECIPCHELEDLKEILPFVLRKI